MKLFQVAALLAVGALVPAAALALPTCPVAGFATGCTTVVTVDLNGVLTVAAGPGGSTYDGSDDQLVGFYNNSTQTISSITLNGNGNDIFGFDGDGIDGYLPPGSGNSIDNSLANIIAGIDGYGGPNSYFTGISANHQIGTVNFITAVAPGGFSYFSLEDSFRQGSITGTPGGATPEPSSLILLGTGALGTMAMVRRRFLS